MKHTVLIAAIALAACGPSPDPKQPPVDEPSAAAPDAAPEGANEAELEPAGQEAYGLTLEELSDGAEVTSPLEISGSASGLWYFEGDFPIELVGENDQVIAQSYVSAQGDWMTEEQVPFTGTIEFDVSEPTNATLVLLEDDPSGEKIPMEERVVLRLMPSDD